MRKSRLNDGPGEERLEPARRGLAVRVEEEEDVALGRLRALQPRPDQPHPLARPQHPHGHGQLRDVLLQLGAQKGPAKEGGCCRDEKVAPRGRKGVAKVKDQKVARLG